MGAKKYKCLPKITKNGLKLPKFGTFIVIKWFYEKIEKKKSMQFLRDAVLHLPRKNNQNSGFFNFKALEGGKHFFSKYLYLQNYHVAHFKGFPKCLRFLKLD